MLVRRHLAVLGLCLAVAAPAVADWNPSAGQWGKTDPTDIRVMTYNIDDDICRTAVKTEDYNAWCGLARIIAAMKPDVVFFQEAGDNSGNGTGSNGDSVAQLTTTVGLFLHGGADPFLGGTVGAYVQKYDASYDLPYVFVSGITDNYNRNIILSRFPFADLNGDGVSQRSDISALYADLYAPGGGGGIRGFMFAEINLPDDVYAGDLVAGCAHLKAYSDADSQTERLNASKNVAYYIDYLLNGAGTGTPDPRSRIMDNPPATSILSPETPVIIGGDWNEDENTNGRRGPAEWLVRAEVDGGTDGTDRNRTDATYDSSVEPYSGSRGTYNSSSKLDYLAWQDSVATLRRSFLFYSNNLSGVPAWLPPELTGFTGGAYRPSSITSPHRPVIADFVLALAPPPGCPGDLDCDGLVDFDDIHLFVKALSGEASWPYPECPWLNADCNGDDDVNFDDITPFVQLIGSNCP